MSTLSIFDIASPVMVGPSSSHTAGACKIGQFARAFFNRTPKKVTFYLHGSFAEVYKGHATDRALLGGVLKFRTSDPRIRDSFKIAEEKGLEYQFIKTDLGPQAHPNTVQIVLEKDDHHMSVTGCSVGGGMVEITEINGFNVHLKGRAGQYLSLVVCHKKGAHVVEAMKKAIEKLDISVTKVVGDTLGNKTISVFSTEGRRIKVPEVIALEKIPNVHFVRSLSKLEKQ